MIVYNEPNCNESCRYRYQVVGSDPVPPIFSEDALITLGT